MPAFDIVCKPNEHEIQNAFEQANKEILQRFDFKETNTEIKKLNNKLIINSSTEDRVKAAHVVLIEKLIKRKVSLKFFEKKEIKTNSNNKYSLEITINQGINKENFKQILDAISKINLSKILTTLQGEIIRVVSKNKDDLQKIIQHLKQQSFEIEILFTNFRD